jgi:hypothetical protein
VAAITRSDSPVQLSNKRIVETYVQPHGHTIAHYYPSVQRARVPHAARARTASMGPALGGRSQGSLKRAL